MCLQDTVAALCRTTDVTSTRSGGTSSNGDGGVLLVLQVVLGLGESEEHLHAPQHPIARDRHQANSMGQNATFNLSIGTQLLMQTVCIWVA